MTLGSNLFVTAGFVLWLSDLVLLSLQALCCDSRV